MIRFVLTYDFNFIIVYSSKLKLKFKKFLLTTNLYFVFQFSLVLNQRLWFIYYPVNILWLNQKVELTAPAHGRIEDLLYVNRDNRYTIGATVK